MAHRTCAARLLAVALTLLPAGGDEVRAEGESDDHGEAACQRVQLVDAQSNAPVAGAEDFVVDRESGQIFLAAYDRWALDDAISADAESLPQGAIYAAPLRSIARQPERLPLRRLADGEGRDFHPHGLAIYRGGGTARLYAINHEYRHTDGNWTRTSAIESYRITPDGLAHRTTHRHAGLCRANNLTAVSARDLLITRDHGACGGWDLWLEDILGLDEAEVVLASLAPEGELGLTPVATSLAYANGIALGPDGATLAVAATRERAVRIYDLAHLLADETDALRRTVTVSGGPDNLTWTADGGLVVAVHPSLWDTGLARHRWFGARRAASKAVAVNPDTGLTRTLFHNPSGKLLNAGTTAAVIDDNLIVSAVLDDALVVCRP